MAIYLISTQKMLINSNNEQWQMMKNANSDTQAYVKCLKRLSQLQRMTLH